MLPLPYWIACLRTRNLPNVRLQRGNFYDCDLRDAQAVTCYLMIKPMPKLADFLDRTLQPGTPVIALATARPAKFPDAVERATGVRPPLPPHLDDLMQRPEGITRLPNDPRAVAAYLRKHARPRP